MYECDIKNIKTGERGIIFTHYPNNPFKDNPNYDSQEWEVWSIVYID